MRISDWSSDVCSSDLENFHSFAGVPIVRREQSVGVLCVQHVEPRRYEDVEIEALQTVAMVLAELIAGAGLVDERAARSEEHTSELQSLMRISYAVFCLNTKNHRNKR